MDIISYVTEEVKRQGHDIRDVDGLERVSWMLNAWCEALKTAPLCKPSISHVEAFGKLVEPYKNSNGFRTCGVRVGPRICPPYERVPKLLEELFTQRDVLKPIEFYKHFEEIHPFVDGNGRTGKILLNWLNGSLLDPIFPPADIFGYPIRNP